GTKSAAIADLRRKQTVDHGGARGGGAHSNENELRPEMRPKGQDKGKQAAGQLQGRGGRAHSNDGGKQNGSALRGRSNEGARAEAARGRTRGVGVSRMFTRPNINPLDSGAPALPTPTGQPTELIYERRASVITNPDGSIVFKMEGAEIPSSWSQ